MDVHEKRDNKSKQCWKIAAIEERNLNKSLLFH